MHFSHFEYGPSFQGGNVGFEPQIRHIVSGDSKIGLGVWERLGVSLLDLGKCDQSDDAEKFAYPEKMGVLYGCFYLSAEGMKKNRE